MPDIYLPNIIKLELTNFSLYCEQSVVMDFSKPVSCLMGANGIGKSTLLNCVNFAITGRINPTNKKLKSIDTLDRGNNYYLQYFDGRISEVDKDYASTRIVFMLGNKRIEVVRNFFPDNSILEYKLDNETQDPRNYEDDVVRLANLNNYAQFVFLQLKVLTFDESRDCLFWNPSILIEDRDQLKMEYDNLCVSLEKIYRRVQVDFLPIFKKFAKEFTGLDLDMTLVSVTDDGRKMFKFILQIDDTNRDNEFELSESQRFFIDIALRMAIVTFVCSKTTASTSMLIDTPEGSLDIAYETNAGSMFYEYIAANQKMIITANLNSSGLIQTLAGKTKFEKFELISMLKWAKLSSVQNTHFELFERSISTIESKLEG